MLHVTFDEAGSACCIKNCTLQQCQGKGSPGVVGTPYKAILLHLLFSKSHFIFHPEVIKVCPSLMLLLRWVPGTWKGVVLFWEIYTSLAFTLVIVILWFILNFQTALPTVLTLKSHWDFCVHLKSLSKLTIDTVTVSRICGCKKSFKEFNLKKSCWV